MQELKGVLRYSNFSLQTDIIEANFAEVAKEMARERNDHLVGFVPKKLGPGNRKSLLGAF